MCSSPSDTYFDTLLLPEKLRLLVGLDFSLQVNWKMTFIAAVMCSACHGPVCEFALATYLPRPLGEPWTLVSKEELLFSLLPSPPHKSYVLSCLAPIARVSEGIQDIWRISSPTPFTKKGWFPFTSVGGAHLGFLGSSVGSASVKPTGFILDVLSCASLLLCSAPSLCAAVFSFVTRASRVSEAGTDFLCCVSQVLHQRPSDQGLCEA